MFTAWFEAGGYSTKEIEDQMEVFAAEVMPVLRRECGGGPKLQESTVHGAPLRNGVDVRQDRRDHQRRGSHLPQRRRGCARSCTRAWRRVARARRSDEW